MIKNTDRRVLRTRKAIFESFLFLLTRYEMDDISVKMIAEQADIGRKTFYLHYLDKYELIEKITESYLAELEKRCEKRKQLGLAEAAIEWFDFFDEQRGIFKRFFSGHGASSFRKQFLAFTIRQLQKKEQVVAKEEAYSLKIQFLSYAVAGIMEAYVLGGVKEPKEELAEQVSELVMKNLREE